MKKSIKIFLLLLSIFIIGLIFNFQFGLSTQYNFFSAKLDISKGNIKIIRYGLPIIDENLTSKKYGFSVEEVGCTVTHQEINGINQYNNVTKKLITKKYGKEWEVGYNHLCDSVMEIIFPKKN